MQGRIVSINRIGHGLLHNWDGCCAATRLCHSTAAAARIPTAAPAPLLLLLLLLLVVVPLLLLLLPLLFVPVVLSLHSAPRLAR